MSRFLLVATVFALGCTREAADRTIVDHESALAGSVLGLNEKTQQTSGEAMKAEINALDDSILALVLEDFASRRFPLLPQEQGDDLVIVVDTQIAGPSGFLSASQISAELRHSDWTVPPELVEDLAIRNSEAVPLGERRLGERVALEDLSQFQGKRHFEIWQAIREKHPKARAYVVLWLPGYSKDQTQAVVRFSFGPTPHGATATYLLVKENGKWKIKAQDFAFYV
jgi:hypothetical protein